MEQLSALDQGVYESVLGQHFVFWFDPSGAAFFHRHFGIPESYAAWREEGVIACIVYAHFEVRLVHGKSVWRAILGTPRSGSALIHGAVREWLGLHRFLGELVGFFN